MKSIFGKLKMSWFTVILFAIATGLYTGIMMVIPSLKNTSFQDIGTFYEWWVIFAIIVVVNCKKEIEAAFKCFIFFLISQPIIYGVQILLGYLTLENALIFYRTTWLPMTFLTLPGGFIAYFCKKQNVVGAIILGIGNTILGAMGIHYIKELLTSFPHHLLSAIVCFVSIVILSFYIQKEKRNKIIAIITPIILVGALAIFLKVTGRVF